jgi:uncharacterized protein YihD (DUF1040 family)
MTRKWPSELNSGLTAGKIALPTDKKKPALIRYSFTGVSKSKSFESSYRPRLESWEYPAGRPANPGFVFYALADGSFAVWDPARNYWTAKTADEQNVRPAAYVFDPKEVWDGLQKEDGTWLCNGLIRDWALWQKENGETFRSLETVLKALSPSEDEPLQPGALTRISLDDVRDMPTLKMPYQQEVPVVHASSGMRRIIALSYFLVWCWEEHIKAKALIGEAPETKAVFLVDEVESHLHPKWQRTVIPALMDVMKRLTNKKGFEVQLIAVTHSPLIMSSLESRFDAKYDKWFDFDLTDNTVVLKEKKFEKYGEIQNWLTSEAFDMDTGYSTETERVLKKATAAMKEESFSAMEAKTLDAELKKVLSPTDPFWIRWRFIAAKKGWLS